ncbi:MAG: response regulator [Candidatus Omnitrophica bacterium]|nr:response regulator [Candidatus Omnitrophota bacterium]
MARKRILMVDDEETFAKIVKMNLEQAGEYEVIIESRASKAVACAMSINPDLILLDIMMPEKDGLEILEALKKNKKTVSIPVIMMTAVDDDRAKIKAAERYSEGYIVKPVTTQLLKETIDKVLTRR